MRSATRCPDQSLFCFVAVLLLSAAAQAQDCVAPRVALSFDGVDDAVVIGPTTPADLYDFKDPGAFEHTAFTAEAWIKTTTSAGFRPIVQKWGACSSSGLIPCQPQHVAGWFLGISNGSLAANVSTSFQTGHGSGFGSQTWTFGSGLDDGSWHHVAMVVTPNTGESRIEAFIDGTSVGIEFRGVGAGSQTFTSAPLTIGVELPNPSAPTTISFDGLIDEVRIWNAARTAAELEAGRYTTVLGSEPGLVGYWRLDDGASSTATQTASDLSPTNADGTLGTTTANEPEDPTWSLTDAAPVADGGIGFPGQPNGPAARLEINGAGAGTLDGPFAVVVSPGDAVSLTWTGDPYQPLILLGGPLNTGHTVDPFIGTLDIGSPAACGQSDIALLFEGLSFPGSLFYTTDAAGSATQTSVMPLALPPGLFLAVQGAMGTTTGFPFRLTAAFQIVIE